MKNIIAFLVVCVLLFSSCKKDSSSENIPSTLKDEDIAYLRKATTDWQNSADNADAISPEFRNHLRLLANDIDGYYDGTESMNDFESIYQKIRQNIYDRLAIVTTLANEEYHNSKGYVTLSQNMFVLMGYDALTRNDPNFMWTKLGIYAANEVRYGVVLSYIMLSSLLKHNKEILLPSGEDLRDVLQEVPQLLLRGQMNVFADIGALSLMNKYGADHFTAATWLTQEARNGFILQKEAEDALLRGDIQNYRNIQTQAAIWFGAHEQLFILQPLWDLPLLHVFSDMNISFIENSGGALAFFGDIFIGKNKLKEFAQGYNIKFPRQYNNLTIGTNRVEIARNGFETLNNLRKTPAISSWIEKTQKEIGYGYGIYNVPSGMRLP
jgi:hypothetical protein